MLNDPRQVLRITQGKVFTGEGFAEGVVAIDNERFLGVGVADDSLPNQDGVLDASGCYVIPGLIDLHFHGCKGADVSDASIEGLHAIARYEAKRGVTAICPATMTLPAHTLADALACAAQFEPSPEEAALVGINLEGPYISAHKLGAQNPEYVRPPSITEFEQLQEAADGLIKLVDIAPETPSALEFIDSAHQSVRISIAHTACDYECAANAFEHGARHMTHLFNAMPGLHHRNPGPIAAAAERDDVMVELICDGVHLHPSMVRLAFKLFGDDRVVLISDSMRACGLGDGTFDLGGQDVSVQGSHATLADGTLAGSVTDLASCLERCVHTAQIPLASAVRAATENPARALGIWNERGSITPGKIADVVLLDENAAVVHVVMRGRLLF